MRVSQIAGVSECECFRVQVSGSASVWECECLGVRVPRILQQSWLAGGEAVCAEGEGRAEGENSSTFSCRLALVRLRG